MVSGPLERPYGRYRLTFRKADHTSSNSTSPPSPHIEVWKGNRKLGNYDPASAKVLFSPQAHVPNDIKKAIRSYLHDPQVREKVKQAIEESFFDLSKPAGEYGGIPKGFWVTVSVEYTKKSLRSISKP